mmetsp:Transcript_31383/g.68746  ORF Transcript_31383/g.68746 Transcript_31383/m.68746 type:complete len:221 (+) Transcript_31383:452-1114(+)
MVRFAPRICWWKGDTTGSTAGVDLLEVAAVHRSGTSTFCDGVSKLAFRILSDCTASLEPLFAASSSGFLLTSAGNRNLVAIDNCHASSFALSCSSSLWTRSFVVRAHRTRVRERSKRRNARPRAQHVHVSIPEGSFFELRPTSGQPAGSCAGGSPCASTSASGEARCTTASSCSDSWSQSLQTKTGVSSLPTWVCTVSSAEMRCKSAKSTHCRARASLLL